MTEIAPTREAYWTEKLKTDELKIKAYKSYCDHIASGKPKKAWVFEDEENDICLIWATMENYFKRYPELCVPGGIFDPRKEEAAYAKNFKHWFGHVEDSATGINQKASTASLQMVMRNCHDWDKDKKDENAPNDKNHEALQALIEKNARLIEELDELKRQANLKHSEVN